MCDCTSCIFISFCSVRRLPVSAYGNWHATGHTLIISLLTLIGAASVAKALFWKNMCVVYFVKENDFVIEMLCNSFLIKQFGYFVKRIDVN